MAGNEKKVGDPEDTSHWLSLERVSPSIRMHLGEQMQAFCQLWGHGDKGVF